MRSWILLALALVVSTVVCVTPLVDRAAADDGYGEGRVRLMKTTSPAFDRFTSSEDPAVRQWIRDRAWRMLVYGPYFDDKNRWYPGGWVYKDLYAIYRDDDLADDHPEWILRDADGRRLYIPWGCDDGVCPQYAADIGDPRFRAWWIERARQRLAQGYRGLYIDDVNLEMRVSDGQEDNAAPIDRRTGAPMTEAAWRAYMAAFVEQIRQAFPGVEIVHNAIWFAAPDRQRDPHVRRQIRAADWVNLERGVNDDGLTSGSGKWSLRAFLSYIDEVHALGRSIVLDPSETSEPAREYSLASYFLVDTGRDGVGLKSMTPENWWSMFDIDLGAAKGPRFDWRGLIRRDYEGGMALVNEPGDAVRTVELPAPMLDEDGATVTSVTLKGARGTTLRSIGSSGAPPAEDPPSPVRLQVRVARSPSSVERGAEGDRATARSDRRRQARRLRLLLRAPRAARHRWRVRRLGRASRGWTVVVRGRVRRSADGGAPRRALGRVRLLLRRADGRRASRIVRVRYRHRFSVRLRLPRGAYRLRARYVQGAVARASASARFVVPRRSLPQRIGRERPSRASKRTT